MEGEVAVLPVSPMVLVLVLTCASIGFGALALAPARPDLPRFESRVRSIGAPSTSRGRSGKGGDNRRRLVEETLREIDARESSKHARNPRPTLVGRMRQAGIGWNRSTYMAVSAILAMLGYSVALTVLGFGVVASLAIGTTAGLVLPHLYVSRRRSQRLRAFSAEFPNSLDVVVRGVQAGLALLDCLEIIASEAQEPVRREFAGIMHDQTLGVPLDEALQRLALRVPLPEANFFAIVIAIQSRTGGNLAEALGNLAKVLRDRHAMRSKIKALSAEAKTSAIIIGCMPVSVGLLLYLTSPDYVGLLLTTTTGNIALAASGVWMMIGTLLMRKMINFDF